MNKIESGFNLKKGKNIMAKYYYNADGKAKKKL